MDVKCCRLIVDVYGYQSSRGIVTQLVSSNIDHSYASQKWCVHPPIRRMGSFDVGRIIHGVNHVIHLLFVFLGHHFHRPEGARFFLQGDYIPPSTIGSTTRTIISYKSPWLESLFGYLTILLMVQDLGTPVVTPCSPCIYRSLILAFENQRTSTSCRRLSTTSIFLGWRFLCPFSSPSYPQWRIRATFSWNPGPQLRGFLVIDGQVKCPAQFNKFHTSTR